MFEESFEVSLIQIAQRLGFLNERERDLVIQ
jgi:hypothetical protein